MKNVPITPKIMLIIAIFGIFVLGVAFYSSAQMHAIAGSYEGLIKGNDATDLDLSSANRYVQEARSATGNITLATTDEENNQAVNELKTSIAQFSRDFDKAAAASPSQARDFIALKREALTVINSACQKAIQDSTSATLTSAILIAQSEYLLQCSPLFLPLTNAMAAKIDAIVAQTAANQARLKAETRKTIIATYAGILGGLMVIGALGFFGARAWIIDPIKKQISAMSRLANGDYGAEVAGTERRDEVGAIARAVAIFRDASVEKARLEAEAAKQRARGEEQRNQQEAQRALAAQQISLVVDSLAIGLEKLSEGDLLFRLNSAFSADYEKLRADFNSAMDKLQGTMRAIAGNTRGVRSGSSEITQAADDLSRRTEQQAASLEETSAALDEITATVRKTAESASEARTTVTTAKADAEHSGDVVRNTVTAMTGIENSSKQISNIIGVIDEIAFQTNLLALNAGVEAARAGEAGRGFAVVATEVRALAQRSAVAAKEIKELILASSREVESGVRLVGETGKALDRIVKQVGRLNILIADIAASAQEQATGLTEVNTAVNQMDQVTQQNAAMVEQATAASHSLAGEADRLAKLVAQFQISSASEQALTEPLHSASGRRTASAPRSLPERAAITGAPPKKSPATAYANAAAARGTAPALVKADDSWREF